MYRSDNRGDTWTKTGLGGQPDISNSESRQQGERLAVDPIDANIVYFGSAAQCLLRSEDSGANWTPIPQAQVPLSGEEEYGVGNVMFDPNSGTQNVGGRTKTKVIYATVHQKGVYRSADAGQSWQKISGGNGPSDSVFQPRQRHVPQHQRRRDLDAAPKHEFAEGLDGRLVQRNAQDRSG